MNWGLRRLLPKGWSIPKWGLLSLEHMGLVDFAPSGVVAFWERERERGEW